MMKKIFIFFLFTGITLGQTGTNLEIFYMLIDSVIAGLPVQKNISTSENNEHTFFYEAGSLNQLFNNKIVSDMKLKNYTPASMQESELAFVIEETSVVYGDMFRDGWFGSYQIPRKLSLNGNYLLKETNQYKEFSYSYNDTIAVDSIITAENEMYPFTRGQIPAEPFFPSLIEPIIAIGTTALAVILFFSIRSN